MYDQVFWWCVMLLKWGARVTGTTYQEINVIIFCILWPAFTVFETVAIVYLWRKRREKQ